MRTLPTLRACSVTALITCAALVYRGHASSRSDVHAAEKARIEVPADRIRVDDGDSIDIRWPKKTEHVRILGIDTPEVLHLDHDIPYAQPFGDEAMGFLRGCLAVADKIELLRSGKQDAYGRTLAYLLLDGRNYSVLVLEARLAYGPNPKYGDNGFPDEYAACVAAGRNAGPLPFEEPHVYRRRMRKLSAWMKKNGTYPRTGSR
jgi:endonuclease YncB( thermonuclease family)